MNEALLGAMELLTALKENALAAYGKVTQWVKDHPATAELLKGLITAIMIRIAANLIGDALTKVIRTAMAR